jgi:hypothetical protein
LNPLRLPFRHFGQVDDSLADSSVGESRERPPSGNRPASEAASARKMDAVEAALAQGLVAIAEAMPRAKPGEIVALADRMATLARELEARRLGSAANVLDLDAARKRGRR